MNINQVIDMVVRLVVRQVIGRGVNKGIEMAADKMSRKKDDESPKAEMTPEAREMANRGKQMVQLGRRVGRF